MARITGLTANRMIEIEDASIVGGEVDGDNLILTRHDGRTVNAGNVRGPIGPEGPAGVDKGPIGRHGRPDDSGRLSGLGSTRYGIGTDSDFRDPSLEIGRRIVILHAWETEKRDLVRGYEPTAIILMYRNLTRVARPSETFTEWGARSATGITLSEAISNGWASSTSDPDAGVDARVALIDGSGYNSAWVASVLSLLEETAGTGGWDGVFADDIVVEEDGTEEVLDWESAQTDLVSTIGPALRSRGVLVIGNMCGSWGQHRSVADPLLEWLDGGLDEFFATWPGGDPEQGFAQAGDTISVQEDCLALGKIHIAGSPLSRSDDSSLALYIWYMALMGTDLSARSSWSAQVNHYSDPPTIPAGLPDSRRLGFPLESAKRSGSGWVRRFSEGTVRVNSSRVRATIDGVDLEPFSGAIAWLPSIVVPAPPTGSPGANYYLRATDGVLTWAAE